MKRFSMTIRNNELYSRFIEILNTVSEVLEMSPAQYNRIDHDFLMHLIDESKDYREYNEILGTIAELITMYSTYQRYIDFNQLFDTITNLLRSEYNL